MSWFTGLKKRVMHAKSSGQILLIYGVASMGVMGFAGLAVDGGQIFTQRRLGQNGADAAALVGARDIVKGNYSSVDGDVTTYARNNTGSTATVAWNYVDNAGATVSQSEATGVTVLVTKTFNTFFIQALGVSSFTVSARGTALVQTLAGTTDVPFIVCANALQYAGGNPPPTYPGGILDYTTSPPSILESAVGTTFWIHGSQLGQDAGDCGWTGGSANFKGNAQAGNGCAAMPCYYPWDDGTSSGTTDVRVAGMQGCSGSVGDYVDGCVALLPITAAKDSAGDTCPRPLPTSNGGKNMCIVAWSAFQLYTGGGAGAKPPGCGPSNCHKGVLLGNVLVTQGAGVGWTPGASGTLVVRLLG